MYARTPIPTFLKIISWANTRVKLHSQVHFGLWHLIDFKYKKKDLIPEIFVLKKFGAEIDLG